MRNLHQMTLIAILGAASTVAACAKEVEAPMSREQLCAAVEMAQKHTQEVKAQVEAGSLPPPKLAEASLDEAEARRAAGMDDVQDDCPR